MRYAGVEVAFGDGQLCGRVLEGLRGDFPVYLERVEELIVGEVVKRRR